MASASADYFKPKMKIGLKRDLIIIALAGLVFFTGFNLALAQSPRPNVTSPALNCGPGYKQTTDGICEPIPLVEGGPGSLTGVSTLMGLLIVILRYLLYFAGAIAVAFVIVGGYRYVTSGGNEEASEKGKKTLINALLGVVAVILAYTIITVITNLITTKV